MNIVEVVEEQVQQVQEIEWTTCGRRLRTRAFSVAVSLRFLSATGGARTVVGRAAGREGRAGSVLAHLENLSVRNQRGGTPRLDVGPMRDAKRLYLSGLSDFFF